MMKFLYICCAVLLLIVTACDRNQQSQAENTQNAQNTPKGAATSAPAFVDVIHLAGGDWGYPSPFAHYPRGPGGFKMALIFDSLLERDEKGLIPWLAESYTIEDHGLTYRFKIRQGIHWQDGTILNPEDVAFSLQYANQYAATWSYVHHALDTIEVEQDAVVVRLSQPQAVMLDSIGRTRIIPRHIWEKVGNPKEFTTPEAVIGCGPYRLSEYSKEHGTYRFEAFGNYWGPKPRVKTIEFIPVSEPILAYENHELDMIGVPPDVLPRFKEDATNKIIRNPAFWGYRLLFNMSRVKQLQDVRVRRAIAYSIDRQELVDKIARGAAVPGRLSILPPDHIMAARDLEDIPFDPAHAKALLAETNALPEAELLCSGQEVRIAELLRERLGEVDIHLAIKAVDGKSRDARVRAKDYQLAIIGHGGWGGDAGYLRTHLLGDVFAQNAAPSASGIDGLDAPELAELLHRQAIEIDSDKRWELLHEIQQLALELVPEIPLFYTAGYTAYRPTTYDGWMNMYDHHAMQHSKLSYLERTGAAAKR